MQICYWKQDGILRSSNSEKRIMLFSLIITETTETAFLDPSNIIPLLIMKNKLNAYFEILYCSSD